MTVVLDDRDQRMIKYALHVTEYFSKRRMLKLLAQWHAQVKLSSKARAFNQHRILLVMWTRWQRKRDTETQLHQMDQAAQQWYHARLAIDAYYQWCQFCLLKKRQMSLRIYFYQWRVLRRRTSTTSIDHY